jgi:hypothetical protein
MVGCSTSSSPPVSVRPIFPGERDRLDTSLDEHHRLGHRLVVETMRYGAANALCQWVALVGFLTSNPAGCYPTPALPNPKYLLARRSQIWSP